MEYGFVDCHCHISAREFEKDLEDVIQRTKEAGVKTLVAVTEEVGEFDRVLQLQSRYPDLVAPCFGLHPLQEGGQRSVNPRDLDAALPLFYKHRERLVAIGEIGLDFTPWCAPSHRDREDQLSVFIKQLGVAKELQLPVNVHSRSAARVTMETMREQGVGRALLHNFAGKPSVALEGVKAGFFFSFPPAVCRNHQRDNLIKQIPLEHICLETDSPALGLHKHERNEPCNIALCCRHIADVKGDHQPPKDATRELQELYPHLWIALRIAVTRPVTVASAERSFSKLKLMKTYLRSSWARTLKWPGYHKHQRTVGTAAVIR